MNTARILCLETAQSACSVCLTENGTVLSESTSDIPNSASERLHGLVEDILRKSGMSFRDINAIAVSNGPGSYTGLRIGVAAAKGYAYALQVPLIAVSTLQAMAAAAKFRYGKNAERYVAAIDARRNEIFWAMFDADLKTIIPESPLQVDETTKKLFDQNQSVCLIGNGVQKLCNSVELPQAIFVPETNCLSSDIAILAREAYIQNKFADPAYLEPNYTKEFFTTAHIKNN